jgi:hypothetical protein
VGKGELVGSVDRGCRMLSEVVVELEVVKVKGVWYRRGLDMRGNEVWEEVEVSEYVDELEVGDVEWV